MGVEYSAVIVVGLPYEELDADLIAESNSEVANCEDLDEIIDELGYEIISRYYDAPTYRSIVGIVYKRTNSYSNMTLGTESISKELEQAQEKFFKKTGHQAKVFLSTYGY